jgi:hypothetical protein
LQDIDEQSAINEGIENILSPYKITPMELYYRTEKAYYFFDTMRVANFTNTSFGERWNTLFIYDSGLGKRYFIYTFDNISSSFYIFRHSTVF